MKVIVKTDNYQVERDDNNHFKFTELQKDNRGIVFPVLLKTADDYARALAELSSYTNAELEKRDAAIQRLTKELVTLESHLMNIK